MHNSRSQVMSVMLRRKVIMIVRMTGDVACVLSIIMQNATCQQTHPANLLLLTSITMRHTWVQESKVRVGMDCGCQCNAGLFICL